LSVRPFALRLFQSAPVIADGRSNICAIACSPSGPFQSAPVIADGRSQHGGQIKRELVGFNPRPSSLTGDPVQALADAAGAGEVSIRARHR